MDDYILRETAIKIVKNAESRHDALFALRTIPSLAIVRCKNCLRWKRDAYGGVCDRYGVRLDGDWFCAGGEKREAQHDD